MRWLRLRYERDATLLREESVPWDEAALRAMRCPVPGEGPAVGRRRACLSAGCLRRAAHLQPSAGCALPAPRRGANKRGVAHRCGGAGPAAGRCPCLGSAEAAPSAGGPAPRPCWRRLGGGRGGGAAVPRGGGAGGEGGRAHSRSAPRHWPRRRAGQHVTGGAVAAAALAQQLGAGGAERPGRALAAAGWRRGGRGHGVSTGGSTGRLPAVPLRGCCKAVKAAGGEEKAAFVARKTGQGERAGAAGKGDGRHPRRRAAASRAGLATGTKPPRSAPRPRGGSFRGAAVAAPLCRCRAETARGAGRREAEPRGARSR